MTLITNSFSPATRSANWLARFQQIGLIAFVLSICLLPAAIAQQDIKPNTIAILPVPFVNSATSEASDEMAKFAQNDIYNTLMEKLSNIAPLTVQDIRVTNSLLKKAGIDVKSIDDTPIEDLQKILGVDHIVAGKVSYVTGATQTSTNYGSVNGTNEGKDKSLTSSNVATSNTDTKFKYNVYFDLYRSGSKIYSKTRTPFGDYKNAWVDGMTYLLKRSPIYVK